MAKHLQPDDFRSLRWLLEPDDFLISDGEDEAPSDLVTEDIWKGIVILPDDVSIRTSSHYGTHLRRMHDLWASWIDAAGDPVQHGEDEPLFMGCLEAADEFMGGLYNALCGYYRVAATCLRTALERIVVAAYCELCGKNGEYQEWRNGTKDIPFGKASDILHKAPEIAALEAYLQSEQTDSIFAQRRASYPGGAARRLHSELSKYTHSVPGYTSFDQWQSTGPVFEPEAFTKVTAFTYETAILCFIIIRLAQPAFDLPNPAEELFYTDHIHPTRTARASHEFLFRQAQDDA